ncbi:DUF5994 family protein [Cryptosporangium arvum]|uniref:DUF5994 family protein n=1 Tax=Cryptosporangium arvum TaxID=80871 RepID=UPI0004B536F7|nr:DUF5994 family protein [Cryptosporangium arvum]
MASVALGDRRPSPGHSDATLRPTGGRTEEIVRAESAQPVKAIYHSVTEVISSETSPIRLQLDPALAGRGMLDGGWWPYSTDPLAELPTLIMATATRGDHGSHATAILDEDRSPAPAT